MNGQKLANIHAKLSVLREGYYRGLPQKITELETAIADLQVDTDFEKINAIYKIIHALTGSGATFGFPEISKISLEAEYLMSGVIKNKAIGDENTLKLMIQSIEKIKISIRTSIENGLESTQRSSLKNEVVKPLVYVIDDDLDTAKEIALFLEAKDIDSKIFDNSADPIVDCVKDKPALVISDIIFGDDEMAGFKIVQAIKEKLDYDVPIGFISANSSFKSRLFSARVGADFYFQKPFEAQEFSSIVSSLIPRGTAQPYRVLIVDDDREIARVYKGILTSDEIVSEFITDPTDIIEAIDNFQPELILMDMHMPECNGIEVAAVVRQANLARNLPIVFLSTEANLDRQIAAQTTAGDDFLTKPIEPEHLYLAVKSRASKARQKNEISSSLQKTIVDLEEAKFRSQEINRIQTQFFLSMSHEIRTPLNGILGMTQLLSESETSEQGGEYLRVLRNSGEGLVSVVNDLLDFSKISTGNLTIEEDFFDIDLILEEVVQLYRHQADRKDISLKYVIDKNIPCEFYGDPIRLKQILSNLVGNAVTFTDKGHVDLEVSVLRKTDNNYGVKFSVCDSGVGLSENQQKKLLSAFSSPSQSVSGNYGGIGLGLSICKHLVNLMGGTIRFKSQKNLGTEFIFELTLEKHDFKIETDLLKGAMVLVSSRDEPLLKKVKNLLPELGAKIELVSESKNIVPRLNRSSGSHIDYLIIDDWEGIEPETYQELSKTIQSHRGNQATEVIIVGKPNIDEGLFPAGYGLLSKMFSKEEFEKAMRSAAEKAHDRQNSRQSFFEEISNKNLSENSSGNQILVVDDHPINVLLARKFLEKLKLTSDVAVNGLEAVKKFEENNYGLILMDCQMPEMDGYDATRAIRAMGEKGAKIPIIALTAHFTEGAKKECEKAGMNDFLAKPVKFQKLESLITSYLGSYENEVDISDTERSLPGDASEVINLAHLASLRKAINTNSGEDHVAEMIKCFSSDTGTLITDLRGAIRAGDFKQISFIAHKIKGGAANLGAFRLSNICTVLFEASERKDLLTAARLAKGIEQEFNSVSNLLLGQISEDEVKSK